MKKCVLLTLFIVGFLWSCTDKDDHVEAVHIRIKNSTGILFNSVEVGQDAVLYEKVEADGYSEYIEYQEGYAYDFITIASDSTSYTIQPVDSIEQTPLPIGFYTYEITIDVENNAKQDVVLDF